MGPLLFNIYINDLTDYAYHSDIFLCADNAQISKCINCVFFQYDIDRITAWCVSWQFKLNLPKCSWDSFRLAVKPVLHYKFLEPHLVMPPSV